MSTTGTKKKELGSVQSSLLLRAVNEHSLLKRLEGLWVRVSSGLAEDELGLQAPVGGDVPGGSDLLVNQGVVMLQVGAEAFLFQSSPH